MDGLSEDASATLARAPEAGLVYRPMPKAVGSPKNKGPELVRPIENGAP